VERRADEDGEGRREERRAGEGEWEEDKVTWLSSKSFQKRM